MVDGILKLISSNPQRDRDTLVEKKASLWGDKSRKILSKYGGNRPVLRNLYLSCDDDEIYNILKSFFSSVKSILWDNAKPQSVILKTIGISVLFDILKLILEQNNTIREFDDYIYQIRDIEYSNSYFQLSGVGKSRLRRVLKYKLGFIGKEELVKDDLVFV
jgi:hypothetical protein